MFYACVFVCVSCLFENTRLDWLLVWILLSGSFFPFFVFKCFIPSKNRLKSTGHGKNPTNKCKQCFVSVSAVVFTNCVSIFLGWLKKEFFAENTMKMVVTAKNKTATNDRKSSKKVESISGPRLGQYLVQVCCAT